MRNKLQPQSNAGKIRKAFDDLGWDADVDAIRNAIGPVENCFGTNGKWRTSLLSKEYIQMVFRKFKPAIVEDTDTKSCSVCVYWRETSSDKSERGYCVRFPPVIIEKLLVIQCESEGFRYADFPELNAATGFPIVLEDCVCGEFKPK